MNEGRNKWKEKVWCMMKQMMDDYADFVSDAYKKLKNYQMQKENVS